MLNRYLFMLAVMICFLFSCQRDKTAEGNTGTSQRFDYARLIEMTCCEGYDVAVIRNPWDTTKILQQYVLVSRNRPLPDSLPEGILLKIPLQNVVMSSVVYCSLWKELGAEQSVSGICDTQYLISPYWRQAVEKGDVIDVGGSMNMSIEKLVLSHCEVILLSPFNKGSYGGIEKIGIPILECADYMESSPLGRAEWMRFYGHLLGRGHQADSLFKQVEKAYMALKDKVADVRKRPTVFMDMKVGDTWYQPGANSTIGRLVSDAGGDYVFSDYPQQGSVPLPFETVLHRAEKADMWLIRHNGRMATYSSLAAEDERYTCFSAWKNQRIWVCDTYSVPFFEDIPFHPERLLKDFVRIMHPERTGRNTETVYYTEMR